MMKKITLTTIITLMLYGCGGGSGNGGGDSTNETPGSEKIDPPEAVITDFDEGSVIPVSSNLSPDLSYTFKTYNEIKNLTLDHSVEMSSGCSIIIYSKYTGTNASNYKMLEDDILLEAYEPNCVLSEVRLSFSNKIEELMVVYSDNTNVFYSIISI